MEFSEGSAFAGWFYSSGRLDHGFTMRDYRAAFREAEVPSLCDMGMARLCGGVPQRNDEGYQQLVSNPPTLEEMKSFFVKQRDLLETEAAAERAIQKKIQKL